MNREFEFVRRLLEEVTQSLKTLCLLTRSVLTDDLAAYVGVECENYIRHFVEGSEAYDELVSLGSFEESEVTLLSNSLVDSMHIIFSASLKDRTLLTQLKRDKSILKKPWFLIVNQLFELVEMFETKTTNLLEGKVVEDDDTFDSRFNELNSKLDSLTHVEKALKDKLNLEIANTKRELQLIQWQTTKASEELAKLKQQRKASEIEVSATYEKNMSSEKARAAAALKLLRETLAKETNELAETRKNNSTIEEKNKRKLAHIKEEVEKFFESFDLKKKEKEDSLKKMSDMKEMDSQTLSNTLSKINELSSERIQFEESGDFDVLAEVLKEINPSVVKNNNSTLVEPLSLKNITPELATESSRSKRDSARKLTLDPSFIKKRSSINNASLKVTKS